MASGLKKGTETEANEPFKRQGSLRKVLPPKQYGESMLSMSAKMIERPQQSSSQISLYKQAYTPFFQEYSIMSEYNLVTKKCLPGLYVMPSASSPLLWFGVLFIKKGLYQGGIFRFNLEIPETFPDCTCPRVVFESKVFHPSIDIATGEVFMNQAFPEWKKDVNHLWQILEHVLQLFLSIDVKDPVNQEASNLYVNDMDAFANRVKECIESSQNSLFDEPTSSDPYYLRFNQYDEKLHKTAREALKSEIETKRSHHVSGLSWVRPGSLEPFSQTSS